MGKQKAEKKKVKSIGGNIARRAIQEAASEILTDPDRWAAACTAAAGWACRGVDRVDSFFGGPSREAGQVKVEILRAAPAAGRFLAGKAAELLAPFLEG